jgi:uncharacterized protein YndB with AHSA1/START domain
MTITTEFDSPIGRVWQLWENPRQLERWWGPPTYPATVVDHDLTPGGKVSYFMTGPDGGQSRGYWRVLAVDAPYRLDFENGFADDDGSPNPNMPVMVIQVVLTDRPDGGTRMAIETTFPSPDAMTQILSMGIEEGMTLAVSQIDGIL